ncbi:hypothetical protein HY78_18925 [Rhizorhabdus wittichii DC-6]|nr:hypothetical protein HY78_18925 [Rhizorhabdus wittichii DC-6]
MSEEKASDVAAIVGRLTAAQRRWLLRGNPYGGRGYWPVYNAMRRLGLLDAHDNLSRLGLALRNHLMEKIDVQG